MREVGWGSGKGVGVMIRKIHAFIARSLIHFAAPYCGIKLAAYTRTTYVKCCSRALRLSSWVTAVRSQTSFA